MLIFLALFSFSPPGVFAQSKSSNCAVVKVGNPLGPKPECWEQSSSSGVSGTPTQCTGATISLGVEKKLLPLPSEKNCSTTTTGACGRPGKCIVPKKIVIHTTWDNSTALGLFNYFASGSEGRGVGVQFVVDKKGKVLQMTETLNDKIELAYGVSNYNKDSISIELSNPGDYPGKSSAPPAQYTALLLLVKSLMSTYKIPVGNVEYDWISSSNSYLQTAAGIFGHYQLNPRTKSDPGKGFLRDFRNDLKY